VPHIGPPLRSGGSEFAYYFDWHLSCLLEKVRAAN
jgi:hypothetical protein